MLCIRCASVPLADARLLAQLAVLALLLLQRVLPLLALHLVALQRVDAGGGDTGGGDMGGGDMEQCVWGVRFGRLGRRGDFEGSKRGGGLWWGRG